ncbi:hypothetical protein [Scytonema millei]|uniref:Uncharacterized protein n=1 Tax=Scytonema millei VB511283 TaxID=1245923 RepID=A0A9X5ECU6_9CYAN|nr:hypothetical protein [Scytonema millei]NHC37737.1 hypothetical protein [Scytonema millei VB511283]
MTSDQLAPLHPTPHTPHPTPHTPHPTPHTSHTSHTLHTPHPTPLNCLVPDRSRSMR